MNYTGARPANRYLLAYGAAVFLHVLLFLFQSPIRDVVLSRRLPELADSKLSPMKFEFVESPDNDIDSPPPEPTPFVSDKSSVSKNLEYADLPLSALPYLDGLVASRELQTALGEELKGFDQSTENETGRLSGNQSVIFREIADAEDAFSLIRENQIVTQQQIEEAVYGRQAVARSSLLLENHQSTALEKGGLQLSTYEWDFAPYLRYLKQHIERHIFPPPAFSELGMIEGTTRLKFRILRNGKLEALRMLDYEGSIELKNTSVKAVELSAEFRPLPEEFPEEYLEITGTFHYFIFRDQGSYKERR